MGNLTVRIDDKLKREADKAAALLDISLSQVIRKALRTLVSHAKKHADWEGLDFFPSPASLNDVGGEVNDLVIRHESVVSNRRLKRLGDLAKLEKTGSLSKADRAELAKIRAGLLKSAPSPSC